MKIDELFDQSVFVKAAISGVASEAVIAGLLTAPMILAFLASWRSTLIVAPRSRWPSCPRSPFFR
jgi:multidrug efflux pump subunit AcrB